MKHPTMIRLDEHFRAQLKRKAREESRTVSDVIREYLARGLRQDGYALSEPAKNVG